MPDNLLIFLSHASEDKRKVRDLCRHLREDGFDPWLDEERILPGQDWNLEIEKAQQASGAILLCFSAVSVEKEGYIQREYKRAMEYQEKMPEGAIFVIPVRLDNCKMPHFIQNYQWINYPDGYDLLVKALKLRGEIRNKQNKKSRESTLVAGKIINDPNNKQRKKQKPSSDVHDLANASPDSENQKLAFEKIIRKVIRGSSATIAYGAALLAAVALVPGTQLTPELAGIVGGVGVNILSNVLERMAKGDEVPSDELIRQIKIAIEDLDKTIKRDEFFKAYDHLLTKLHDSHNEHQIIFTRIDRLIKTLNSEIKLTPEQKLEYLDMYLQEVQRFTRKLPWGHALSAISSDLEISQIYVSPTFIRHEILRTIPIVMDEKQERDLERREKEIAVQQTRVIPSTSIGIYDLVGTRNHIAIIGYMGTGKSITANYIAWLLARRESLEIMGFSEPKTPILIRLGDQLFAESSDFINSIFDFATRYIHPIEKEHVQQVLKEEWDKGNVVIILDALDEYAGNKEKIKSDIEYLVETANPSNQFFLTSRPSAYRLLKPAGFTSFELNEIEDYNLDKYIRKWVAAILPTSDKSGVSPEQHVAFLKAQIANHPLVESMVANPLLLTILVALSLTEDGIDLSKIENETDLYHLYINHIIYREELKSSGKLTLGLSKLLLQVTFGYVGLLVQVAKAKEKPELPSLQYIVDAISKTRYFAKEPNSALLVETCIDFWEKTGLLIRGECMNVQIGFRHQAFQYFGAALGLKFLSDEKRGSLLNTIGNDPQWFDVLRLYLGQKQTLDFQL